MVKVQVTKILAIGCNKRFAWIKHNGEFEICVKINHYTYNYLKDIGVPTAQSLRAKNGNKKR